MLPALIQETIERELTQFLGSEKSVRIATRMGVPNGHRTRQSTTRAGPSSCASRATGPPNFSPRCSRATSAVNKARAGARRDGRAKRVDAESQHRRRNAMRHARVGVSAITKTLDTASPRDGNSRSAAKRIRI